MRSVADAAGVSLTTLAIAWVLANPAITALIISASRPEQLCYANLLPFQPAMDS